jgi:hypothetical protein
MPLKEDDDDSIRGTLEAAFKSSRESEGEATETPEKEPSETAQQADDTKAEKKEEEPKKETEAPKSEASKEEKPETEKKESDDDKPIDPPARWTKEQKEEFALLDPKTQRLLASRNKGLEADYTRKMTEIAQERTRFKAVEDVLASRRSAWQNQGISDADALNSIMSYWDLAQRDPDQFIEIFAQERGMDLAGKYAPSPQELEQYVQQYVQENYDPETGAFKQSPSQPASVPPQLQSEIQTLRQQNQLLSQQLGQVQSWQQETTQQQQQRQQAEAQAQLAAFESATDETGNSLRPFFQDVKQDMARLMQAGIASTLEQAYEAATYARPDIRAKIEESREIARRREEEAKRREEAARAKLAGSSVSTSSAPAPTPSADDEDLSLREMIARQFEAARSRDSAL